MLECKKGVDPNTHHSHICVVVYVLWPIGWHGINRADTCGPYDVKKNERQKGSDSEQASRERLNGDVIRLESVQRAKPATLVGVISSSQ